MIFLTETRQKIKCNTSYCFFLIAFLINATAYSQNPTDNCNTGATALTVGCSCQKINWDIATNAGAVGACGGTGEDGWDGLRLFPLQQRFNILTPTGMRFYMYIKIMALHVAD